MGKESDKYFLNSETIDFLKYIKNLKKNKLLIILFVSLITSLTFYISYKKDYYYQGIITFKNDKFNIKDPQTKTCRNINSDFLKNKFGEENNLLVFYNYFKSINNKDEISFKKWKDNIEIQNYLMPETLEPKTLKFIIKGKDKKVNQKMIIFGETFLINTLSSAIYDCIDKANENMQKEINKIKYEFYSMREGISKYILDQKLSSGEEKEQVDLIDQHFAQKTFNFQNKNRNVFQVPSYNLPLYIVKLPSESLLRFTNYQINLHKEKINSYEQYIQENIILKNQSVDYFRIINSENILYKDIKFILTESIIKGIILSILFSIILFFWQDVKMLISKF